MLSQRLQELEDQGRPIQVGVIGAGVFGTQIIAPIGRMKGMRVAAVADLNPERAARAQAPHEPMTLADVELSDTHLLRL